jgi:superfamily II DNA or RNA helicase
VTEKIKVDVKNKNSTLQCSPTILKLIREKFSIKNPNYQSRKFADRIYAITPSGAFQTGIWYEIEGFIRSLKIPVEVEISDEFKKQFTPSTGITEISKIPGFTYYDYQEDTLKEFLTTGRGISILATGAGKALIAGGLCKTFLDHHPDYKILISVPNTYLLNQLYDSFIDEFGITSVTKWGDKNVPDLSKNIIIANNQILVSDIKATLSVVQNFDVVIVDEVHRIGDKKTQIGKVIHNIPTPRKFGLTGTLPDDIMTMWNVIGKIGPIIYEKNSYDIRKKGAITDIEVNVIVCNHQTKPAFSRITNEPTEKYNQELDYIMNLSSRNEVVRKIVHSLSGNILVMVDRIDYGNTLLNILQKEGKKVFFIQGDTPTEERNRITSLMENETGIICIAMSTIFSTGVSVKNLHYAVFTYIGKSTVKIVQSIGRTVRKHETKNKAIIFDIADNLPYSFKHLKERLGIYKDQRIEYKTTTIKI